MHKSPSLVDLFQKQNFNKISKSVKAGNFYCVIESDSEVDIMFINVTLFVYVHPLTLRKSYNNSPFPRLQS